MHVHVIHAFALVGLAATTLLTPVSSARGQAVADRPRVVGVSSVTPEKNKELSSLIAEIRNQTDAFVILSGGASRMREDHQRQLLSMFEALGLIAKAGRRIGVGDGGTQAGIMEAAGQARRASGNAFPLIGVAPAREIPPLGKTPPIPIIPTWLLSTIRQPRRKTVGAPRPRRCIGSSTHWPRDARQSPSSPTAVASR